jgi:hypothetical protein
LELPVRYQVQTNDQEEKEVAFGVRIGVTINISSGGVAFTSDTEMPTGSIIELWVTWPAVSYEATCMELRIIGQVVRSSQNEAAIQMKRHDFVTSRKKIAGSANDS